MAGADTGFGEALISPADEVQHIFSCSIFAVEYCQRVTALMAEDHSFEQEVIGAASGMLTAVDQHSYLLKSFFVDQRLMSIFYHDPVLTVLLQTLLGLVADLHRPALYHVSDIGFVLQHI